MGLGQTWGNSDLDGDAFPCRTARVVLGGDNRATRAPVRQTRGSWMPLPGIELLAGCIPATADAH